MQIRLLAVAAILVALLISACSPEARSFETATASPFPGTSTPRATSTASPSETPLPPSPLPTVVPVEGVTSTQLNVRAEPSTAGQVLGLLPANTKVEITGKDPGESWWQINYPQGAEGKGWITSQYVTAAATHDVPVIGGDPADPSKENVAVVQQQLNIRSGPGTGFNSLGTLNPQDVISLTGKDANGAWLQIEFPSGPEGKGWVNAAFVRAQGVENLPIITEAGEIVGTGTPTSIPFTPTPTVVPAAEDDDALDAPVASVIFEPAGTRTLIYSGDLSSPQGDADDWIAFKPYSQSVFVELECSHSDSLTVDLLENGRPTDLRLVCGTDLEQIAVTPGANYVLHMQVVSSTGTLQYTAYTLTVSSEP